FGSKFCEYLSIVWFGDNRASIEFHERGKKHKEALAAKLRELSRASREKEKAVSFLKWPFIFEIFCHTRNSIHRALATGLSSKIFDPRQLKDIGSMAREMAKRKNEMQEIKAEKRVRHCQLLQNCFKRQKK
uniref:U1-type domain-containing protein n=1 Tax=Angiostrongylus cantonensis TaxID=6313 RepID=A0A0K0CWR2_ANGCA